MTCVLIQEGNLDPGTDTQEEKAWEDEGRD